MCEKIVKKTIGLGTLLVAIVFILSFQTAKAADHTFTLTKDGISLGVDYDISASASGNTLASGIQEQGAINSISGGVINTYTTYKYRTKKVGFITFKGYKSTQVTITLANHNPVDVTVNYTTATTTGKKEDGESGGTSYVFTDKVAEFSPGGTLDVRIPANSTAKITMTAPDLHGDYKSYTTIFMYGTITINSITADVVSMDTKFAGAANGSYNVKYNGELIESGIAAGEVRTASKSSDANYTVTASASSGHEFGFWYNAETGEILSYKNEYSFAPEEIKIAPLFKPSGTGVYYVKGSPSVFYFYLDEAIIAAGPSGTIVVCGDGNVMGSSGQTDFTIPKDVKFIIPYSGDDEGDKAFSGSGVAEYYNLSTGVTPYRTLKVPSGTSITVKGSMCANCRQISPGRPNGPYGRLVLQGSEPQLIVTGSLYAWGYITGTGNVIIDGGTVYEMLEFDDFHSAVRSVDWYQNKKDNYLFMMSQYFIQNVEAPMTLKNGAKEYISTQINTGEVSSNSVQFIGDSGLFIADNNTVVMRTREKENDRVTYNIASGTLKTGFLSLDLTLGGFKRTLKTSDCIMPFNANMTFHIQDGATMSFDYPMALLPDTRIIVESGGNLLVTSNLFLFDSADWNHHTSGYYLAGTDANINFRNYVNAGTGRTITWPTIQDTRISTGAVNSVRYYNASSQVQVDGTLTIRQNGNVFSSNNYSTPSADKGIVGTGKIIVEGNKTKSYTMAAMSNYGKADSPYYETYSVSFTRTLATVFGESTSTNDYKELSAGPTYYGTSDEHTETNWYTNAVISYDLNGGTGTTPSNKYIVPGDTFTVASGDDIKQPNVKFYNWNTAADGSGTSYSPNENVVVTQEMGPAVKLYAQWKPITAQIIDSNGTSAVREYISLADAVEAYDGNGYIKMTANTEEPGFTLGENLYLDLNGKTVTLTSGLDTGSYKLYGMDTATDDYDGTDAGKITGTVSGTVAPVVQTELKADSEYSYYRYVAIQNGSELSFHRFNISVTGYRFELAAPQCALIFRGEFRGDEEAKTHLKSLGFTLKDADGTLLDKKSFLIPKDPNEIPNKESNPGESLVVRDTDGAYLFEFYLKRSFEMNPPDDTAYTEEFSAIAHATFDNGGTQDSGTQDNETQMLSFKKAWRNALSDSDSGMEQEGKAILTNFLNKFGINIYAE